MTRGKGTLVIKRGRRNKKNREINKVGERRGHTPWGSHPLGAKGVAYPSKPPPNFFFFLKNIDFLNLNKI
jgi:hypothetical protein